VPLKVCNTSTIEGVEATHPVESSNNSSNIESEKNSSTLETIKEACDSDENKEKYSTLETIRKTYGNDENKNHESILETIKESYDIGEKSPCSLPIKGEEIQNNEGSDNIKDDNEEQVNDVASTPPKVDCEHDCIKQLVVESMPPTTPQKSSTPNLNNTPG